eukprot:6204860-Pleurochrysis_carterae.AAC.3
MPTRVDHGHHWTQNHNSMRKAGTGSRCAPNGNGKLPGCSAKAELCATTGRQDDGGYSLISFKLLRPVRNWYAAYLRLCS